MQYVRGVNTEKMGQSGSKQREESKEWQSVHQQKSKISLSKVTTAHNRKISRSNRRRKQLATDHPDSGSNGTTDNGKENVVKLRKKQRERGKQTGQPSSEKKLQKRISFYETVDASEILPPPSNR